MTIHPKSLANLQPAEPGNKRAAKPAHQRASANINLKVTPKDRARLKRAATANGQTLTGYLLDGK